MRGAGGKTGILPPAPCPLPLCLLTDRPQRNGEKVTDWFACSCWSKTAETVANYCKKGKQVAILGRIEFDYWQDKNTGEKRSKAVVKVERIELLGSNNGATGGDSLQQVEQMPHPSLQPVSAAALSDDDNIPF